MKIFNRYIKEVKKGIKMTAMDILWVIGWFLAGLVVFQVRGIKGYWGEISDLSSILGFVPLLLGFLYGTSTLPNVFIGYIGSIMIGFLSSLAYLIGANISRYIQFGEMSPRIVVYVALFFVLWIILDSLF